MSAMAEASELIGAAARDAGPAVVGLGPGRRGGTGVVVAEGRILTAAHNLRSERRHRRHGGRDDESAAAVVFPDGRREEAEVVGVDRDLDLAVLAVDTGGVAPLDPGTGTGAIGSVVVALARPGGRAVRGAPGVLSAHPPRGGGPRGGPLPAPRDPA